MFPSGDEAPGTRLVGRLGQSLPHDRRPAREEGVRDGLRRYAIVACSRNWADHADHLDPLGQLATDALGRSHRDTRRVYQGETMHGKDRLPVQERVPADPHDRLGVLVPLRGAPPNKPVEAMADVLEPAVRHIPVELRANHASILGLGGRHKTVVVRGDLIYLVKVFHGKSLTLLLNFCHRFHGPCPSRETLRGRLVEASRALLELEGSDPVAVMGYVDALKLRSCMTLFSLAEGADPAFKEVLDRYYGGEQDPLTLELLGMA